MSLPAPKILVLHPVDQLTSSTEITPKVLPFHCLSTDIVLKLLFATIGLKKYISLSFTYFSTEELLPKRIPLSPSRAWLTLFEQTYTLCIKKKQTLIIKSQIRKRAKIKKEAQSLSMRKKKHNFSFMSNLISFSFLSLY